MAMPNGTLPGLQATLAATPTTEHQERKIGVDGTAGRRHRRTTRSGAKDARSRNADGP